MFGINFDEFSRQLSKMNNNVTSISLDEEYRGLISKRFFVLSKIETDGVDNERIHDDVRKWLNEVEKVVKDVKERKASRNAGTMDDEWSSTMIKKIKRLCEKCRFTEYCLAASAVEPISIKTQDVPTPPQPPSVEEYASRTKVGSSFSSKVPTPPQPPSVEEYASRRKVWSSFTSKVSTPPQPPSVEEYASRRKAGSSFSSKVPTPPQPPSVEEYASRRKVRSLYSSKVSIPSQPPSIEEYASRRKVGSSFSSKVSTPPQPPSIEEYASRIKVGSSFSLKVSTPPQPPSIEEYASRRGGGKRSTNTDMQDIISQLSKVNNVTSISLDEEYWGLITERSHVLNKIEMDGVENERIHDDVRKWLNEVEKVVKDVNERKASNNAGTMDDEWSSTMIKKMKRLYEERSFPEYYIPRAYFYYRATPAIKPISIKTRDVPTPSQPTSVEEYASRRKVGSSFSSKEAPNQQLKVDVEDDACDTVPSIPTPSVHSFINSTKETLYTELEAQKDDTCHKAISRSSTTPLTEPIPSAKSMSSNSTEGAFNDDTFEGLQLTSGDFMYLGSTSQGKNNLLKALQDDRYHSIGLFGKRGSGKTTLVKAEIPKYENIFRLVVSVTVSEQVDIAKLQNQIAHQLNLKLQAVKSKYRRASAIESALLKSDGKVLVIFDDVSTNFGPQDIEDIGIPDPSKQCKILLITHDKKYCNMIRCHPWIPLRPLSDEDAWKLLQQYSGIDNDSPSDLISVAREVAFLCLGLPRVIEDVVSSLHNKDTEHWKETLDCLNHSTASHQIFISFRGKDTRDDFTASLFDALVQGGFKVFKDDEQLRSGDQVSEALIKAIEQSRCSIVVLSENYAESSWCLDELVRILTCRQKMKQLVLPIFCKVDPSNVRYLKGSFGEAMTKKKERFKEDKIQEWTSALFEVAGLSGRDYKTGSQIVFIKEIVQYVRENKHRLHIV